MFKPTKHTSYLTGKLCGGYCVAFVDKIDRIITALHCISPEDPFHTSWAHNSNLIKSCVALMCEIIIRSGHNFVNCMTAELLWYMQTCDLIGELKQKLKVIGHFATPPFRHSPFRHYPLPIRHSQPPIRHCLYQIATTAAPIRHDRQGSFVWYIWRKSFGIYRI